MKKIILTLIGLHFYTMAFYAQEKADSIPLRLPAADTEFSLEQLILPASLVTAGTFGLGSNRVKALNRNIKDKVAGFRSHYTQADDYIQYLPVISVYGLSLAGAKPKHDYIDRTLIIAASYLSMGIMVNSMKYSICSARPNSSSRNSFPSGHTATAVMGAELVRKEYRDDSPWYGIAAYSVATGIGLMRIYNEKHWMTDVFAGAGVGILSARIGYWLLPFNRRLTGRGKAAGSQFAVAPFYTKQQGTGIGLSYRF
ncbi:MAG: phosphatase PAP2 family protein [Dysgonamonadaceae bacterium]|jgi:hypothetical protein|nr:phosphatase PAP2 family protein [Dysgonamonadaceae bacterium]